MLRQAHRNVVRHRPHRAFLHAIGCAALAGCMSVQTVAALPPTGLAIASATVVVFSGFGAASAVAAEVLSRKEIEALKSQVLATGDAAALQELKDQAEFNTLAMVALGDVYSRGGDGVPADGTVAAEYYEKALAQGVESVRTRLVVLYRDGTELPADPTRALELLTAAAEAGDHWAMFHLAQGHLRDQFGDASRRAEGVRLLKEAMAAGNPQAVAALSNLYLWGHGGVRSDPQRAVALLEQAADQGNSVAARNLIAIYRDGRGKLIPKNAQRASALLDKYAELFDPAALATERLLADRASTETSAGREALVESYVNADASTRRRLLLSLRAGNPNAYVFLLQDRLKSLGRYTGRVDGRLSSATIRAINSFCRAENIHPACRQGPLSVEAATALADVLK